MQAPDVFLFFYAFFWATAFAGVRPQWQRRRRRRSQYLVFIAFFTR